MVDEGRARGRAEVWRPWLPPWATAEPRPEWEWPGWAWPRRLADFASRLAQRIVERVERITAPRLSKDGLNEQLERVRVSVRKGTAPAVGSFVEFKARLSPPLEPLRPGGYDFARDMYFQRIGASGFALGRIRAT